MQKSDWKKCKLGDVVDIIMGTSPKGCDINEIGKGMPFFQGSAEFSYRYPIVKKYTTKPVRQAKRGDILFSVRAPIADINIAPKDCAIGRGVAAIRSKAPDLQRYIEFVLKGTRNEWEYLNSSGSVFGCAKKEDLLNFEIPWNDEIDVLLTISQILGSLDDKIELLQKQNKTLEDMAKALFKSWFVDFDVVRAKQKGLPKADIMREYHLTDDLYDLFPSSFADSPLGPIPSGWEVVKISDVARVVGGGTPSTKQTKFFSASGTAIAWLTPKDLSGYQYKYIDHGQTDITQEGLTHSSAQLMPTNSIVFSSRAPIGYIAISLGEIATNQGFKSLVPLERHWTEFLYQYLCYNRYIIEGLGTGSTFKEVSGSVMKNISLCFPSSEILKAFEQETEIINSKQKIIMKEIQTLTELRDTLLPRLISGKIRV